MLIIRGGTLIDGTGGSPRPNGDLIVVGNRINEIRPAPLPHTPQEATVLPADGKVVMPGLIDCHAHMAAIEFDLRRRATRTLSYNVVLSLKHMEENLLRGVTTVRDAGGADAGLRDAVAEGLVSGPRMLISIHILSTALPPDSYFYGSQIPFFPIAPHKAANSSDQMRSLVREQFWAGADVIKILDSIRAHFGGFVGHRTPGFSVTELRAAVEEAEYVNKRVMSHATILESVRRNVAAGVHSIEHGCRLDDQVVEQMVHQGTYLVPTLAASKASLDLNRSDPSYKFVPESEAEEGLAQRTAGALQIWRAGGKVCVGSDACNVRPYKAPDEMVFLAAEGIDPIDVIEGATGRAAQLLGIAHEVGTLAPGKLADILIVDGNPLADMKVIADSSRLQLILQGGKLVKNTLTPTERGGIASCASSV